MAQTSVIFAIYLKDGNFSSKFRERTALAQKLSFLRNIYCVNSQLSFKDFFSYR